MLEKMELKDYRIFGSDLMNFNPHWINTYGRFLIMIADLNLNKEEKLIELLNLPSTESDGVYNDYNKAVSICNDFFESKQFFIEGYTLRTVSSFFIQYVKDWHQINTEAQIKIKNAKIEKLKAELAEIENK